MNKVLGIYTIDEMKKFDLLFDRMRTILEEYGVRISYRKLENASTGIVYNPTYTVILNDISFYERDKGVLEKDEKFKQKIKELEEYINQPSPVRERKFNKIVLNEKGFFCYKTDGSDCYDYEIVKKENEELKEKLREIKKAFNAMSKTPFIEKYEKLKQVLGD